MTDRFGKPPKPIFPKQADYFMGRRCPTGVAFSEDGFVVEAELIAQKLGLSPDAFWREMKRGIVYGVVARGEGDDVGRTRLTFRYRARSWSVTLEDTAQ